MQTNIVTPAMCIYVSKLWLIVCVDLFFLNLYSIQLTVENYNTFFSVISFNMHWIYLFTFLHVLYLSIDFF